MLAVIGLILAIVAAILKLVNQHPDWISWLVIFAIILIGIDVVWGWHRGGYYRRVLCLRQLPRVFSTPRLPTCDRCSTAPTPVRAPRRSSPMRS